MIRFERDRVTSRRIVNIEEDLHSVGANWSELMDIIKDWRESTGKPMGCRKFQADIGVFEAD